MSTELELIEEQRDRIKELEYRIEYCERIAKNYADMYQQLESRMKALADRQGNIQAVYDYMTQIGSSMVRKNADKKGFLNPLNAVEEKPHQIEHEHD